MIPMGWGCNGIFSFKNSDPDPVSYVFWNPCNGTFRKVDCSSCLHSANVSMGYDYVNDDYKIIGFIEVNDEPGLQVYSFRKDSWRKVFHEVFASCTVVEDPSNITPAVATENGVTEDVHGSAAFHQPINGSASGLVAMTDSESIVSQTLAAMDHEFAAYVSHVNDDANKNTAADGGVAAPEKAEDMAINPSDAGGAVNSSADIADGSNAVIDGSGVASVEHSVVETSQALGSGTSLNANIGKETSNITSTTATENGVTEDVHGSAAFHQPINGSA